MDPLVWSIVLLLVGVGFVVLEFFLPSGGALSVMAGLAIIASVAIAFTHSTAAGSVMLLVSAVIVPGMVGLAVRFWPHTPLGRLMLIRQPKGKNALQDSKADQLRQLIGHTGTAKTKMLPSGSVKIEGTTYDAISEGMSIEAGQIIQVTAIRTNRMVVRPVEQEVVPPPEDDDERLSRPADTVGIDPFEDPLI